MSSTRHESIPLSLYIHTPWCVQKCPYCDFNSHTLKSSLPEDRYIQTLIQDLEWSIEHHPHIQNRPILSIFIGGGTPSLFSPSSIQQLLDKIRQRLPYRKDIEVTLEANPGTVERTRFQGFLEAGINRLSLGIQSFNNAHLKKLGRIHDAHESKKAIDAAFQAGFKRINLDIMYGLPGQTVQEALSDIETAASFQPEHLSWYQLTLEENTPFYHHPPTLPNDEICWEIFKKGQSHLHTQGYLQYEVSAYAKPHGFCQHNLNYWEFGDYLGIGAGACSKITHLNNKTIHRTLKIKHPKQYLNAQGTFLSYEKAITPSDIPLEFMMNVLRLNKPFKISQFEQRTGLSIHTIESTLKKAITLGWLIRDDTTLQLTPLGYLFLNDVIELFLCSG